jgi:hypothetical protein
MRPIIVGIGICGALLAATIGFAAAQTPAQQECEAAGGTYTFEKGRATCTIEEETNPGNPQSPNANKPFKQTEETTQPGQGGGQGETSPKNPNFSEETGPKTNPGGNAPPGQQ